MITEIAILISLIADAILILVPTSKAMNEYIAIKRIMKRKVKE